MNIYNKICSAYSRFSPSDKIQSAIALGTLLTVIIFAIQTNTLNIQTSEVIHQAELLSNQTSMMQQDFDLNNRPWIGSENLIFHDNTITFVYENFGNIPNQKGVVYFGITPEIPDRNNLFTKADQHPMKVIFPGQKLEMNVRDLLQENEMQSIIDEKIILYISFMFEYEYGNNKKGEYGVIGKFDPKTELVDIIDTWVK